MKIIGKAVDGYILECTANELARLIGYFYYGYGDCPRLNVGDAIDVNAMYEQLYKLKHHERTLSETAASLRTMADSLEQVKPVIAEVSE